MVHGSGTKRLIISARTIYKSLQQWFETNGPTSHLFVTRIAEIGSNYYDRLLSLSKDIDEEDINQDTIAARMQDWQYYQAYRKILHDYGFWDDVLCGPCGLGISLKEHVEKKQKKQEALPKTEEQTQEKKLEGYKQRYQELVNRFFLRQRSGD